MPRRPTPPSILALLAAALLAACGGGSASGPAPDSATPLGLLSATRPTTVPASFTSPRAGDASVRIVSSTGGFAIDPTDLPTTVPAGATFTLGVLVTPPREGPISGSITLRYTDAGGTELQTRAFRATAEHVVWSLLTPSLEFGTVTVGGSAERTARFRNDSALSPVTLRSANFPYGAFQVVGTPFPLVIQPGGEGALTIRFTPVEGGIFDGDAAIGPNDLGGQVPVPLLAQAPGTPSEVITDFGTRFFLGSDTEQLTVDVPANALSLTIDALGTSGTYGLGELLGPEGKVYENTALTGDYVWQPGAEAFSTTVPNTDRTNVQLVPGGGSYRFRVRRMSGNASSVQVRAIVEVREQATPSLLDLNVWLADGLSVDSASAPSDPRLQAILGQMDSILAQQSVRIGDVDYYDVTDASYDDVTSAGEFSQMLRTTSAAAATRLNLFFVQTALGGGVVGVSATVSGPKRNGTSISGVMSIYAGFGTNVIGLIATHELGHFLGLYHTVEQTGTHDFVDDTVDCPGSGTDPLCPTEGGGYLMHWQAVGGTELTAGQGLVLRAHPLLRPQPGSGSTKPTPLAGPRMSILDWVSLAALGDGWCGCAACGGDLR